ncbi:hypothetical protein F5Y19DRAFT_482668 [Xylariaceae sp. FL1651]|nr:hypothetical protein F5Y19DRAFT_482668 [Xylariaceae sp. FL1651]
MDTNTGPVEKLFKSFNDPGLTYRLDDNKDAERIIEALQVFVKEPISEDPDHEYLLASAKSVFSRDDNIIPNFRQHLIELGMQKSLQRKDKSYKARQLRYYKWVGLGRKNETYPFSTGNFHGLASTVRIAALVSPSSCAACGKEGANMRCPDCNFQDDEHIMEKTAYCNKNCLKDHYDTHRRTCGDRKTIYRIVSLLGQIFLVLTKASFMSPLSMVYETPGLLNIIWESWERPAMTGRHIFYPFPKHLVPTPELQRAVLMTNESEEIVLSLRPLVERLFAKNCKSIEQAEVVPKNVQRPIVQTWEGIVGNNADFVHTVLRVTMRSGEQYAIDIAAAELGWKETLAPWNAWVNLRTATVKTGTYGAMESVLAHEAEKLPTTKAQLVLRKNTMETFLNDLDMVTLATPGLKFTHERFRAADEDYKRMEYETMQILQHHINMELNPSHWNDYARMSLGPPPLFQACIAGDNWKMFKGVWFTKKEYDRLERSGADMIQIWYERLTRKLLE